MHSPTTFLLARFVCAVALAALAGCDSGTATAAAAATADTPKGEADAAPSPDASDAGDTAASDAAASDTAASDAAASDAAAFVLGDPPAGMVPLGVGQNGDLAVEVFAPATPQAGQNYLAYRVTAQGVVTSAATITQAAQMQMAGAPHGCPLIDPPEAADSLGLFQSVAVFQMASAADDPWRLDLDVAVPLGAPTRKVSVDGLLVANSTWVTTATAADGSKSIVSLYFAKKPKVGLNSYVLSVHGNPADSDTFPAVADATVKATPLMVTMGHGSNGNVAPVAKGNGLYAGKANFSMPGEWKLTFAVTAAGKSLGSAAFKITL